jgi:hypothetical protein
MKKLFSLNNEPFKLKWMREYGFWRLLWFGILAKFGYVAVTEETQEGTRLSIGTDTPVEELWNKYYKVNIVGYVLYEPILQYTKP